MLRLAVPAMTYEQPDESLAAFALFETLDVSEAGSGHEAGNSDVIAEVTEPVREPMIAIREPGSQASKKNKVMVLPSATRTTKVNPCCHTLFRFVCRGFVSQKNRV